MTALPEMDEDQPESEALPIGTHLLNGQYVIERYLSSGGFGITYLAQDSLERSVVIKECFPEAFCSRKNGTVVARTRSQQRDFESFVKMFVREARSIAKLKHPNIVGVHQVFQDNMTAYMALDRIDGTELLDVIEAGGDRPPYAIVKTNLLKLLDAISAVHQQDMLHRDISPDNILIDSSENPVLIDFGAAREEVSKKSRALSAILVVKDGYSPQEFYISGSQQTESSDLYALAATFYHFITGEMPPDSQTRLAAIASRMEDPCQPLVGRVPGYPDQFLKALDECMNVFPQDRIQSANDWICRIDENQRIAVAKAKVASDSDIEQTVSKLIAANTADQARTDTDEPVAPATALGSKRYSGKDVAKKIVTNVNDTPESAISFPQIEPYDETWVAPGPVYSSVASKTAQPKRGLRLFAQHETSKRPRAATRIAARMLLGASFCFLAVGGHSKPIGQAMEPIAQHVLAEVNKLFGRPS